MQSSTGGPQLYTKSLNKAQRKHFKWWFCLRTPSFSYNFTINEDLALKFIVQKENRGDIYDAKLCIRSPFDSAINPVQQPTLRSLQLKESNGIFLFLHIHVFVVCCIGVTNVEVIVV